MLVFQILSLSVVMTFIISGLPCLNSSAGMLSAPDDFPPSSVRNAYSTSFITCMFCYINTAGFAFYYAGTWFQFVVVELLAVHRVRTGALSVSREPFLTIALCCCFLVSFFGVSKAFLLFLSFMPFLDVVSEIHFTFALIISVLMVPLTVRHCSADSKVEFFVFFMFILISQISRMSLVIYVWIFFLSLSSTSSGCFLYNSLDAVGEDVYVFFKKIYSCEFDAYSSLNFLQFLFPSVSRYQIKYVGFSGKVPSSA